jgi:CheY-like chemotaxis protein
MTQQFFAPSNTELLAEAKVDMGAPCILLAEDDPAMRGVLEEALEEEGYDVVLAGDGFDLLDRIGETYLSGQIYDLVLSDIRMPGCSGLEALEALRERDWATPIVFMTAFGSPSTHEEAERLGASIVDKPFDVDDLLEEVRRIVPPRRYQDGWY